jgi:predicted alpha/beta hydrolase
MGVAADRVIDADVRRVRAADGAEADLIVSIPDGARYGMLWLPALGVSARNYQAFAAMLTGHGIAVALHEWRGAGSSTLRASRACDWSYRELLELDIPASLESAQSAGPDLQWIIAGHSIGGQFASLFAAMRSDAVKAIAIVASGSPYWRTFPRNQRWLLRAVYPLVSVIGSVCGYYPGKRLRFAGNEARSLMRDWAHSGSSGIYAPAAIDVDFEAELARFAKPLLGVQMSDDALCPHDSLAWLLKKFRSAPIDRIELRPEDFPGNAATHFSWLKDSAPVAATIAGWIERRFGAND